MNWPEVTMRSPSFKPLEHLVHVVLGLRAERDGARLEFAAVQRDEDRGLFAAAQNRHVRHQQRRRLQFAR